LQERKLGHYAALLDTVRRYRVCLDATRRLHAAVVGLPLSIDVRGAGCALRGLHGRVPVA
jgi:hypothetical protein